MIIRIRRPIMPWLMIVRIRRPIMPWLIIIRIQKPIMLCCWIVLILSLAFKKQLLVDAIVWIFLQDFCVGCFCTLFNLLQCSWSVVSHYFIGDLKIPITSHLSYNIQYQFCVYYYYYYYYYYFIFWLCGASKFVDLVSVIV